MTEEELQAAMDEVPDEPSDKEIIIELRADIARMLEAQAETTLTRERDWAVERFNEITKFSRSVFSQKAEAETNVKVLTELTGKLAAESQALTVERDALAAELEELREKVGK